jgi:hypothetical protein
MGDRRMACNCAAGRRKTKEGLDRREMATWLLTYPLMAFDLQSPHNKRLLAAGLYLMPRSLQPDENHAPSRTGIVPATHDETVRETSDVSANVWRLSRVIISSTHNTTALFGFFPPTCCLLHGFIWPLIISLLTDSLQVKITGSDKASEDSDRPPRRSKFGWGRHVLFPGGLFMWGDGSL